MNNTHKPYPLIGAGAWLIQFALLFFLVRKKLPKIRPWINLRDKYLNYMLRLSIPVVITTAADQINLAADNIISSDLPSGSISYLGYAHRIFNSINGIVTATLLTIYYPIISKQYSEKDHVGLRSSLKRYLEIMLMLTLSISLILIGNSKIIIDLLLNRGAMTDEGIIKISLLFTIYVAGLLFMSLKEFSTRMFYILGNTKKPTIVNSICVAINIVLSIALKQYWGVLNWGTEPWLITLGKNVHITDGVKFITHDGGTLLFRHLVPDLEITKPIVVGDDVYIGNNVILLPGVTVGNKVVIGAGAIVSRDIPDNSVAVGVPAKVIKTADEYFEKLKKESLHLGHLKGQEKDRALMKHFGYKGKSKGIYF